MDSYIAAEKLDLHLARSSWRSGGRLSAPPAVRPEALSKAPLPAELMPKNDGCPHGRGLSSICKTGLLAASGQCHPPQAVRPRTQCQGSFLESQGVAQTLWSYDEGSSPKGSEISSDTGMQRDWCRAAVHAYRERPVAMFGARRSARVGTTLRMTRRPRLGRRRLDRHRRSQLVEGDLFECGHLRTRESEFIARALSVAQ